MFAKQFFNRNRVFGMAVLAATLASAGAAHAQSQPGSTEAATHEVVQIMSARTGVSDSDITTAIRSDSDDKVVVLASAPRHAGFDRVCRFDMAKDAAENDVGWAIVDQACTF